VLTRPTGRLMMRWHSRIKGAALKNKKRDGSVSLRVTGGVGSHRLCGQEAHTRTLCASGRVERSAPPW
jgi:hypothetical protein